MENSITSTSVSPPKATLTSFASSKDQLTGIGNDSRSVLNNLGDLDQNLESGAQHVQDHLSPNHLYQHSETLRNLRFDTGLSSQPLFDLNEHGYNVPLDQTNPNSFYYGSGVPVVQDEVRSMHTISPSLSSRYQPISAAGSTSLEMQSSFQEEKRRYETDNNFGMRDSKTMPMSLERGCETLALNAENEIIAAEIKDTVPGTTMETVEVTLQLPGIETFSSSVSPSFLAPSKLPTLEPILPNIDCIKGEKTSFSFDETSLINKDSMPLKDIPISSELPYPMIKDDMPFLISNKQNISNDMKQETSWDRNKAPILQATPPNLIPGNQLSTLPQYPCVPSPTKTSTFSLSQPPPLPINYRPLLENLRPIRRTEEIVRLKNDGGKITIVETTDDPGKSKSKSY